MIEFYIKNKQNLRIRQNLQIKNSIKNEFLHDHGIIKYICINLSKIQARDV